MYASSMHGKTGRSGDWPSANQAFGPVGAGECRTPDMHDSRKSDWGIVSVKRANSSETAKVFNLIDRPTTGGVRGEKALGQGEFQASARDRHTEVGSSDECLVWDTRDSSSASAFDPRQEPGAVIPHAGICAGGAG